jgi:hypothetical protein
MESNCQASLATYDTGDEARASLCKLSHAMKLLCSTFFLLTEIQAEIDGITV